MALNKKFPKVPNFTEYRPIIIQSPVIKFLEGYIRPSLRQYGKDRMQWQQFGFIEGAGIEEAK